MSQPKGHRHLSRLSGSIDGIELGNTVVARDVSTVVAGLTE